ncbi:hypothetical protein [Weissella paramesenteroides]|uniref:hypothetical protein n=1 Tax=Weissella paramesenteroides TaxID=1249 RepID=UPI001EE96F47|nr:hypothetical protein [Weissella paramesenteroides]
MNTFIVETETAKLGFEILENNKIILTTVNSNDLSRSDLELKKNMTLTEIQITGKNFHHKDLVLLIQIQEKI